LEKGLGDISSCINQECTVHSLSLCLCCPRALVERVDDDCANGAFTKGDVQCRGHSDVKGGFADSRYAPSKVERDEEICPIEKNNQ